MHVRHPIWLQRLGTPNGKAFAILFALESFSRSLLASVIPLEAWDLLGSGQKVSFLFFMASSVGLCAGLAVPALVRLTARRWVYTAGALALATCGPLLAIGGLEGQVGGMVARVVGVVAMTICINLYIMDNIARQELGRTEPLRIFYSAGAWTLGPGLGVWLRADVSPWAPYALSTASALAMLVYFWVLRLRDAPGLTQPQGRVPGVRRNINRFFSQPRLFMAWLVAVGRNAWWAMFFIYTPIYAVESGLGEVTGGLIASTGTAFLFLLPLWARFARRRGVRMTLMTGFAGGGTATLLAALFAHSPWIAAGFILLAAFFMIIMDALGSLPFMLAVKPSERREMTAVYGTYRDVAELGPPAFFSLLLRYYELSAVFVTSGLAMLALCALSKRVHPRLGVFRGSPAAPVAEPQEAK